MKVAGDRLETLDLIRGVAVMGILLLNIVSFAMPEAAYFNPRAYGGWHGADLAAYLINFVLFDGKMRGLFSFLFGASMLLVIDRAEASGRDPARVHVARMGWLLVFGLAHLLLVWEGDILAHYALIGMTAFLLRRHTVIQLVVLGIMLTMLAVLTFAQFPLAVGDGNVDALAQAFGTPDPAPDLALYRGGYAAILANRISEHWDTPLSMLRVYGFETLAYMAFGMAALRSGMLAGGWPVSRYRHWLFVSWGIGVPATLLVAAYLATAQFSLFSVTLAVMALAAPLRPLMIVGWACLILLGARARAFPRIAAAGRMAFSNYLLTSLICTTLFYGYGLAWYGTLSRWQLYLVVPCVWAAMLLWSKWWLERFTYGPLEWLWRSLARFERQPLLRI